MVSVSDLRLQGMGFDPQFHQDFESLILSAYVKYLLRLNKNMSLK